MIKLTWVINLKKILKSLVLVVIVSLFVCGCTNNDNKHIIKINVKQFEEKIKNKDNFALYIGNPGCSHCASYKPTLNKVLNDYNITIYHIDNSELEDKEIETLEKYVSISGTPTILFITDGQEESTLNRIVGEETYEGTVEKFKVNDYIK